ncbi:MAG: tetratricopeptide repeat protein [Acidobacteriota bacterium]|nr:tetratricopeptide repeat protein [Acidobacteriota bacterium]
MRLFAFSALLGFFSLAAGAGQKPAAPAAQATQAPQTAQAVPGSVERQAGAYANFILGHISQENYEDTGDQAYADQAISYYKKALTFDPSAVDIRLKMAETYAEAQRLHDAVDSAQSILKEHPDDLATHRLLARIYVRSLGQMGTGSDQDHTLSLAVEQYEAILKLDPGDREAGLWLARLYRFQNQPEKAEKVLEQMLARDPSDEPALEQYTQLLLDQGHADEAVSRLSKIAGQASSGRLYDLLGDAYARMNNPDKAIASYRQAIALEPDVPSHWRRLARLLFDQDKYDEAAKAYQQLTSLDPADPDNFLRLAEIEYQQKKYDLAQESIKQAKQRAPDNLEVVYNEALIAEAQGRFSDAIDVMSKAVSDLQKRSTTEATSPRVYGILYEELGRLYRRQGNFADAEKTFKDLMTLGPAEQRRGQLELIETYRENNQIDDAIATAQQGMNANPKDRQLKITYALLLGEKQQTNVAVSTLKSLLDKTAADREIYLDIAQVEQRGRRFSQAEHAARTAESLATTPDQRSAAWFLLGAIYERQKQYGPAEQQFRKALTVNPNDAEVLNYYGYMLTEQGVRLDEASELVKRALAEDANNSAYLDSLGWTYYKQNRLADAREFLLKAAAGSPHDPTILGHLGDVYDRLGETELAINTWQKALAEWKRVVPADYEEDTVRKLERKLTEAQRDSARGKKKTVAVKHD